MQERSRLGGSWEYDNANGFLTTDSVTLLDPGFIIKIATDLSGEGLKYPMAVLLPCL